MMYALLRGKIEISTIPFDFSNHCSPVYIQNVFDISEIEALIFMVLMLSLISLLNV